MQSRLAKQRMSQRITEIFSRRIFAIRGIYFFVALVALVALVARVASSIDTWSMDLVLPKGYNAASGVGNSLLRTLHVSPRSTSATANMTPSPDHK